MAPILALAMGLLLAFRQWQFLMAAEQGRKQDLIKRLYRVQEGFRMLILVPCITETDRNELPHLLETLAGQEYPKAHISLQLVTLPQQELQIQALLDQFLAALELPERFQSKVWGFPRRHAETFQESSARLYGDSMAWLIDRCLTLGSGAVFVFLNPSDHLKSDYLQNVAAKTFEYPVLQGYVAMRGTREERMTHRGVREYCMGRVQALSNRLMNRVGNAGRFHAGLSAVLQCSGFAIKQDVLERIAPGKRFSPRQYTLQLALKGLQIAWAPHVVVYRKNMPSSSTWLAERLDHLWERGMLLRQFGLPLLVKGTMTLNNTLIDLLLDLIQPPATLVLLGCLLTGLLSHGALSGVFTLIAVGILLFQVLGLCVARGKLQDFITLLGFTPITALYATLGVPILFLQRGFLLGRQNSAREIPTETESFPQEPLTLWPETFQAAKNADIPIPSSSTPPMQLQKAYAETGLPSAGAAIEMVRPEPAGVLSPRPWLP